MPAGAVSVYEDLQERRSRIERTIRSVGPAPDLSELLEQVDAALERYAGRAQQTCVLCGDPVGAEVLELNPTARYCLCRAQPPHGLEHVEPGSRLERDLAAARQIQLGLLPPQSSSAGGWDAHYRYLPAQTVSGDVVDVVTRHADDGLYFMLADVSGKGLGASLLMAHLSAVFRTLADSDEPIECLVERANRLLAERTADPLHATLVWGRAAADGTIELSNAGHLPPLWVRAGGVRRLPPDGVPVGLFEHAAYGTQTVRLGRGESLVLYTDGLVERTDAAGTEYGIDRLIDVLTCCPGRDAETLAASSIDDLFAFRRDHGLADDVTLLVLERTGSDVVG